MKRIVVTGIGMLNALGVDKSSFDAIVEGKSGVDRITLFDAEGFSTTIAAEVKGFDPALYIKRKELKKMDRFIQLGLAAAEEALADAALGEATRSGFGIIGANAMAGMGTLERSLIKTQPDTYRHLSPFFVPAYLCNMLAGQLSIRFGMGGPNLSVTTACAAGTHAIIEAYKTLQFSQCEGVLVVGSEAAVTPACIAGYAAMNALSKRNDDPLSASRPFDAQRDGFVLGEGAGALVVETLDHAQRRGAKIYAEITGFGESADAHHMTTPREDSAGVRRALELAWVMAAKPKLDYINAHGTSTRFNDLYEAAAIDALFGGTRPLVSSTKGQTGHTLGAAGCIEAVITLMAMQRGVVPPTINHTAMADEMAPINLVANKARSTGITHALSCNFGFGGTNAAVLFSTEML